MAAIMLVWLRTTNPARESRLTSTPESEGNAYTSLANNEYTTLGDESVYRGKKIRQISLLGERNSGTRWAWSYVMSVACVFFWRTIYV